ncbi:unnamed protein product [Camellia sinensis]
MSTTTSPPAGILGIIKKLGKDSVERQSEQLGEAEASDGIECWAVRAPYEIQKFYGEHS